MITKLATFAVVSIVVYFAIAFALLISQRPGALPAGTSFPLSANGDISADSLITWTARNGDTLTYRQVGGGDDALIIVLHGSGWHSGGGYTVLAENIHKQVPNAKIVTPDLRGHGFTPKRQGDVDYIGQLEDDLTDLITHLNHPGPVILAGHSSGGGLAIRYAGNPTAAPIAETILIAPFLQHAAPTVRPNSGGWAYPLTRRIIGLSILNTAGITAFNHMTILQFRTPEQMRNHGGTDAYSYRLNTSFSPRVDWKSDVARLDGYQVIVGQDDGAFFADQFEPTMQPINPNGRFTFIPGLGHIDILESSALAMNIANSVDRVTSKGNENGKEMFAD